MDEIKIVSNTADSHLSFIQNLVAKKASRLIIASPYLASNFEKFLQKFDFSCCSEIVLFTTFKPNDYEQLTKPFQLKSFFNFMANSYPKAKVVIHIDNSLHGKVYVSSFENESIALITSANFTNNGLQNNHEWGLATNKNEVIATLLDELFDAIEYPSITLNQIAKACLFAEHYMRTNSEWNRKPEIESDILGTVYSVGNPENLDPQYFLKPIGVSDSPILHKDKRDFSELHQYLHFSVRRPKGVRKGDIVITIGVGGGALLSYFIVTGALQHVSEEEIKNDLWKARWPWYMEGRNQAQEFSSKWWTHDLQRNDLLEEFKSSMPDIPVTEAGGFSLGTLNRGNDKVRITKQFGQYLISKIDNAS